MIYECLRCGFVAKQKGHFMDHLNRKNICNPILEPISINEIKTYYNLHNNNNNEQNQPASEQVEPGLEQVEPGLDSLTKPGKNQEKPGSSQSANRQKPGKTRLSKIECEFCGKFFTRTYGLTCHLKICPKKKIYESDKDKEIKELKQIVEQLLLEKSNNNNTNNSNIIGNNSCNTTNTNSHNNNSKNVIIVNNYGNENKDYITNDYLLSLLKKPFQAIPELIKYTHFNDEHPENQNIKITNKKQPYVKIMKNDKWELADRKDTINDLIDQKHSELSNSDLHNIVDNTFKQIEITRLERFNEKYMSDDKEFVSQLYKDTELVIINNSKVL